MGLIVNSTIAEMEDVAYQMRGVAWREVLSAYPINPEMFLLGEQFFEEERKHARLFKRFNDRFCELAGIDPLDLDLLLPKAYGSAFYAATKANAERGGYSFWWVVALVEEVSLLIYQQIYRHRKSIDPLYYQVHRLHFEEESRHTNYAFMMLKVIQKRNRGLRQKLHQKIDLVHSEIYSTAWIVSELAKVFDAEKLAHKHEFFAILSSCLPLLRSLPLGDLIRRIFVTAPYISLVLNRNYHRLTLETARAHGAFKLIYPAPHLEPTFVQGEKNLWEAS